MKRDPQEIARVVVRMHYDPEFARELLRGLPVHGVSNHARQLVHTLDPRAFRTDPLRPVRTLHALMQEFPGACSLVAVPRLREFFGQPQFHDAIMQRRSLALAFGDFLTTIRIAREFARLELALARLRRAPQHKLQPGEICCAPGVTSFVVKEGTLASYESIRARLGSDPVEFIVNHPPLHVAQPGRASEHVYAQKDALGRGSQALHQLLSALEKPITYEQACSAAVLAGSDPQDAPALLDELVADGLFCRG
jgi:hypothetical protein